MKPCKSILMDLLRSYGSADMMSMSDTGEIPFSDTKLLQTTDVLTKITDSPKLDAKLVLNHCLSDIYAAGGVPLSISSLFGIDREFKYLDYFKKLAINISTLAYEKNIIITGGHTFHTENHPLIGFSSLGERKKSVPRKIQNKGDSIFITKKIGTGFLFQRKNWHIEIMPEEMDMILGSNSIGAEIYHLTTSMTDISGYGLAGHLLNCISENKIAVLSGKSMPIYRGLELDSPNKQTIDNFEDMSSKVENHSRYNFIYDNQTNGGLIFTCNVEDESYIRNIFASRRLPIFKIGVIENRISNGEKQVYVT